MNKFIAILQRNVYFLCDFIPQPSIYKQSVVNY